MLQQATPFSYLAPLEPRCVTRRDRSEVDCFCVSTVTDSPSKVHAIAAAPIWYDARLRSHSNGMTSAGRAGNVWGLLNSPHALAVRFHQYTFFLLSSHVYRGRNWDFAACGRWAGPVFTKSGQLKKSPFACTVQSTGWERMTRGLYTIKK